MAEIAEKFEITERQARRDLAALEEAGYPLDRTVDEAGRARVRIAGIRPGTVQLGVRERFTLLAIRRVFDVLRGTALFEDVESIYEKLAAALPEAEQKHLQELGGRFVFLPDHGTKDYKGKSDVVDALLTGVIRRWAVQFSYRTPGGSTGRAGVMEPWALALYRNGLYVVANLRDDDAEKRNGAVRAPAVYAVERFAKAECLRGRTFEVPKAFTVDDYFQGAFGITRGAERRRVIVDFPRDVAATVTARTWHRSQKLTRSPAGGARLAFDVDDLNEVASWILSWGHLAMAREPPELVARIATELATAARGYRKS
jgi:predicted DNA-binding transcriptional regulator YafY